jgi:hypothetical protein
MTLALTIKIRCCYRGGRSSRTDSLVLHDDQDISVHLMIIVQKTRKRWTSQNTFGTWTVLYRTQSSRTQFGVSINVWRLAADILNITCNLLYSNHQVHRDFLITLYNITRVTYKKTVAVISKSR